VQPRGRRPGMGRPAKYPEEFRREAVAMTPRVVVEK
jgi:hypothetical protein